MSVSTLLAKALYDNLAESADELSFRRGEILMVVEHGTAGLGGWWLCSLHGRRGIVPGNRLKLLEGGPRQAPPPLAAADQTPPSLEGSRAQRKAPSLERSDVYQVPPSLERSEVYQTPPALERSKVYRVPPLQEGLDVYQVPPSLEGSKVYRVPPLQEGSDVYQVPPSLEGSKVYRVPPLQEGSDVYHVPPSLEGSKVYRVPPLPEGSDIYQVPPSLEGSTVYRVPPMHEGSEVNRAPSSAHRGHTEAATHERKVTDVPDRETEFRSDPRLSADENEYTVPDPEIYKMPTIGAISETSTEEVYNMPTIAGWDPDHPPLRDIPPIPCLYDDTDGENVTGEQEVYSVPCSVAKEQSGQAETYDVPPGLSRKVAKVSPSVARKPSTTTEEPYDWPREPWVTGSAPCPAQRLCGLRLAVLGASSRLMEAGKEIPDVCRKEVLSTGKVTEITEQLKENQVGAPQDPGRDPLATTDRRLIAFYAQQSDAHFATLLGAIDALFSCLHASQPPRAFVSHGRYVIVSAHKLVFIGDALSRQARAPGVRAEVGRSGALLCQALKAAVLATKGAALRYPALPAVQDMVDKVTELSHHALRFTRLLGHMSLR
uniref:embryonal Fyn-associated substrate-like n=1 Tax=Pristiophorus japonicus TaxID=55135 RepID=UPI00398E3C56